MAEVLAPFGFAFGALGFIFSTVGTVTESWENYHKYERQMGLYQQRLGTYEGKIIKWNMFWRKMDFGDHRLTIDAAKRRVNGLVEDMKDALKQYHLTEGGLWTILVSHWQRGRRLKMKDLGQGSASVCNRFFYVLWRKKKLDGWMILLKEEVDAIDYLSKSELKKRTAEFASNDPDQAEINRTTNLEDFVRTLTDFAQRLHNSCSQTPETKGWALGLRPPHTSRDSSVSFEHCAKNVKRWNSIARVEIELAYFLIRDTTKEGRLQVDHNLKLARSYVPSHSAIRGETQINDHSIKCMILDKPRVRTRPLGELIREGFFKDLKVRKAWQLDCARLLHGISNWMLLLWNTNWTQELCSYGLQIEQNISSHDCFRQLFTAGLHDDQCLHHPWRLRNLGLVLAQLTLVTPLRCRGDLQDLELEEWVGSSWSRIHVVEILDRIMMERPNMDKICSAIEFCLTDESSLAREAFLPGFLFQCLDSIHEKITQWCDEELGDPSFYDDLSDILGESSWPDDAYEKRQQSGPNTVPTGDGNDTDAHLQQANGARPDEDPQPSNTRSRAIDSLREGARNTELQPTGLQQNVSLRPGSNWKKRPSSDPVPENSKRIKSSVTDP